MTHKYITTDNQRKVAVTNIKNSIVNITSDRLDKHILGFLNLKSVLKIFWKEGKIIFQDEDGDKKEEVFLFTS